MSDLTGKFTTLEEQLTAADFIRNELLNAMYSTIAAFDTDIATIRDNNATNARLILNALAFHSSCSTCPSVPLTSTPPMDTTTAESDEFCQRVQAFLAYVSRCCDYADNVGTLASVFTTGFVTSIIDQIRVDLSDSGIPYPGWMDTVVIAADGIDFVINRAIFGGGMHATFDPLLLDLQSAMYAAGSPSGAKSAYDAIVDASDSTGVANVLLKGVAYGDVVNYFLDPSSTPNLAPYDGTVCPNPGCYTVTSQLTTFGSDGTSSAIVWPGIIESTDHTPASYYTNRNVWAITNLVGWTYTCDIETEAVDNWAFSSTVIPAGVTHTFPNTDHAVIYKNGSSVEFTVVLCPPAL